MDKKDSLKIRPKTGDYFVGSDIHPKLLPETLSNIYKENVSSDPPLKSPKKPVYNEIPQKRLSNESKQIQKTEPVDEKEQLANLMTFFQKIGRTIKAEQDPIPLPFPLNLVFSTTMKRGFLVPATILEMEAEVKTKDGSKETRDFYFIICWFQFVIGSLGGLAVGVETRSFKFDHFANEPNVPIPNKFDEFKGVSQDAVRFSSSVYRLGKRAVIAGLLFNFVDKNVSEFRQKQDWKNFGISGSLCGAIFGLRGGLHGTLAGTLLFGAFASVAGYQFYKVKDKRRPS